MDSGLIIHEIAREPLSEALAMEEKLGEHIQPRQRLSWCLSILASRHWHVRVGTDWAPYSFSWCGWYKQLAGDVEQDARADIIGGLIYHGESYDEMVKNFTATVEPKAGWSLHT
jgi:hypothetical protein